METNISLGMANSKLYEKEGHIYYKIWPIIGMQLNFILDKKVAELKVDGDDVFYNGGFFKLKLQFRDNDRFTTKVRLIPQYFWIIPFGVTFGEISNKNKEILINAIQDS
ncbi:hypothetical protein [Neptunicella sp. SCSIO 80796]|uniref:hypothetical protein n=1 Tax=Neptunicella plasticusilytica TaxID=3117012 RepID=UPI003A4D269F